MGQGRFGHDQILSGVIMCHLVGNNGVFPERGSRGPCVGFWGPGSIWQKMRYFCANFLWFSIWETSNNIINFNDVRKRLWKLIWLARVFLIRGGLEGAVCSLLLATWLTGACFVALGSFTGGCQRSPSESCGVNIGASGCSAALWTVFKALDEIHSTEIACPSRSVQGDCSPSGNYIRPLLRSFRKTLYICIPRCSF